MATFFQKVEFYDVNEEEESVVQKENLSDIDEYNSEDTFKCGEIFYSNFGDFIFCCYHCEERFTIIEEFTKHVEDTHILLLDLETLPSSEDSVLPTDGLFVEDGENSDGETSNKTLKDIKNIKEKISNKTSEANKVESNLEDVLQENNGKDSNLLDNLLEISKIGPQTKQNGHQKKKKLHKCKHCGIMYSYKKTLSIHLRDAHQDFSLHGKYLKSDAEFFCVICKRPFSTEPGYKKHMGYHKFAVDVEEAVTGSFKDRGRLACKFCGKQLSSAASRKAHENDHLGVHAFKCGLCAKGFQRKMTLVEHMRIHTGEKPYACPHCEASFALSTNLGVHIRRMHIRQKPFQCEFCDKRFVTTTEKKIHMRFHSAEKPYQCEECGKTFATSSALSRHRLRHTSIKPHSCPVCKKAFFESEDLRSHYFVHTKLSKPVECTICDAKFTRKNSLTNHIKTHLNVNKLLCKICSKSFCDLSTLEEHMKLHEKKPSTTAQKF